MTAIRQHAEQLMSDEWLMSKRLATALKLSPEWRGRWLRNSGIEDDARCHLVEQVNYRRMILGGSYKEVQSKTFTVSTCGRYLLVLSGHDVFVYRIGEGNEIMSAVVRLASNRDVLKVGMDTSSGRYAVAALLDNCTGLLWDISAEAEAFQQAHQMTRAMSLGISTGSLTPGTSDEPDVVARSLPQRRRWFLLDERDNSTSTQQRPGIYPSQRPSFTRSVSDISLHKHLFGDEMPLTESPESKIDESILDSTLAIQTQPTAIYRGLGTSEDPPRSVAICPQRKCTAFGCRLGIELHWVDALTGGDLSRWFPLAAPSDHLYFLPQRPGIDSSRKLRLISSAQGPSTPALTRSGSMPARLLVRRATHDRGRRQSMTRLFFGNLPFPAAAAAAILPASWTNRVPPDDEDRQGILRTVDCDHYQATPLSDGSHVLYTDPASGQLCLGSDAPVGAPTKLVRKVIFIPPDPTEDDGWGTLMSCYTAGHELRWGVQVVAAHRDGRIILYSVPSDLFNYLRNLRSSVDIWDETSGVLAQSDLLMDDVLTAHPNSLADPETGNEAGCGQSESPFRTIQIEGVQVAHVGREIVDDIAVNTAYGGINIWVFCRSGLARDFDIYVPSSHIVRSRFVNTDGMLYDESQTGQTDVCAAPDCDGRGKQRADDHEEEGVGWSSTDHVQLSGFDGAYDIDVDVAGGLWIAESLWPNASEHDAFPGFPGCDDEMAQEVVATRLQILVIGSATEEDPLYAVIQAETICD